MYDKSKTEILCELLEDTAVFIYALDVCPSCSKLCDADELIPVLLKKQVSRGDKVYQYVGTTICGTCAEVKDYNRLRRGLSYWLSEGHLEVLRDVS